MEYKAILDDGSKHDVVRHWGVLGMHWGERRYQNLDGSLTPEGRKRYGVGDGENTRERVGGATNNRPGSNRHQKNDAGILDAQDYVDNRTYTWTKPKETVKKLASWGYSLGEIIAAMPYDLTKEGGEEAFITNALKGVSIEQLKRKEVSKLAKKFNISEHDARGILYPDEPRYDSEATYTSVQEAKRAVSEADFLKSSTKNQESWDRYVKTLGFIDRLVQNSNRSTNQRDYKKYAAQAKSHISALARSGYTNKEIAKMLGVSESTVSSYLNQ